jgi:PAS domain S-box-containing protein
MASVESGSDTSRRLRAMLDFTEEAVALLAATRGPDGAIVDFECVDINPAGCRHLKRAAVDIVGTSLLELLPTHREQGLFERYCRVVDTGEPHDVELHYSGDGVEGWWRNVAVKFDDGIMVRFANITEKRRADIEARRLAAVVEQSSDLIGIAGRDGMMDFLNDAGRKLVGQADQAALRHTMLKQHVAPHGQHVLEAVALPSARAGERWEGELPLVDAASGAVVPAFCSIFPVRDASGHLQSYALLARDMRDTYRMSEALVESEAKFRAIADTLPQMVWSTTPDGLHDYYNARWYEFTGVPPGSTDGEGWNGMFHPDDQERAWKRWNHSLATGEPYEIEYRLRHHSGEYRWTLGRALPIRDAQERIMRWFGTCTDIHESKSSTERLLDTQLRLQLALAAAEIGVWEYDIASGRVIWDKRILRAAGLPDEVDLELNYDEHFLPIVNAEDRDRVDAAIKATAREGRELNVEYRIRPPGLTGDIWVASAGMRVVRADGRVNVIGTAVDISEDIKALEEREIIAQELSHRIKNIFSVISGMIGLSARTYPETRELADQLRARIAALGRAHDFVRTHGPASPAGTVPATLHGLARQLFAPYVSGSDEPFEVRGDDIEVDDRAATPLALLFHELATNSAKYGALSRDGGRVTIDVERGTHAVEIRWKEQGGPPVAAIPAHKGFGSRLTTLSVEAQLGGTISHDWAGDGLACRILIPVASFMRH